MIRAGGIVPRLSIALALGVTLALAVGSTPSLAINGGSPPPSGSCSTTTTSTGTTSTCGDSMTGSDSSPLPETTLTSGSTTLTSCYSGEVTEPANTSYPIPSGDSWIEVYQQATITSINPATGGGWSGLPDNVLLIGPAYSLYTVWELVGTFHAKTKTAAASCTYTASYLDTGYTAFPVGCATAGDCATLPSSAKDIATLAAKWAPTTPTSAPPGDDVVVWNPTTFSSSLNITVPGGKSGSLPSGGEVVETSAQSDALGDGRVLNITIQTTIVPTTSQWVFEAKGGASGTEITCDFDSGDPYELAGGATMDCSAPGDGSIVDGTVQDGPEFTHDAASTTMKTRVELQITTTAYFETSSSYTETLQNVDVWSAYSPSELGVINQTEGI